MYFEQIVNERNRLWLLKNSLELFPAQNFVCKLLNLRLARQLKFAEITALVPFSTGTPVFANYDSSIRV